MSNERGKIRHIRVVKTQTAMWTLTNPQLSGTTRDRGRAEWVIHVT